MNPSAIFGSKSVLSKLKRYVTNERMHTRNSSTRASEVGQGCAEARVLLLLGVFYLVFEWVVRLVAKRCGPEPLCKQNVK